MIKLLKKLTKKDCLFIFLSFLTVAATVWLDLKMPDYMSAITKLVETEGSKIKDILINGGYMLLCAFGSLTFSIITGFFSSHVSANFSKNVRKSIFDKVLDLSDAEIKEFQTSSLITRTTNDVTQVQMCMSMILQLLVKAPLTAVLAITKILDKSTTWSILTGISISIIITALGIIMIIVLPRFKKVQKLLDKLNNVTRENLTGIRVIRAFNAEEYQENKFDDVNSELTSMQMFNQKTLAIMSPLMTMVMYTLALAIYFTGAKIIMSSIISDKITVFGNMIVFSSYALQVIMSFLMLAIIFMMIPRANVSASRINEVLEKDISIKNGTFKEKTEITGTIEFRNVTFRYPDASLPVLEDISFKANKGETIAFIGSTGSGKSTLINLIPRFYDITSGEILIDNLNVKEYDLETLYNKIGYVSQKAVMFSDTVKGNITFGNCGKEITDGMINTALEVSQSKEFVEKMDNKTKSLISRGGTNISGGQKQRLSIARAIARKPEIYIFDDSFSALDYKTDSILRRELKKNMQESTCLIVAQRIGTIMNADKIVVLDQGKCVGIGTHKELLKTCKVYKEIALSQLSKEELENA